MTGDLSDKELLGRLVEFPTVSRDPNAPLADWIADYLDRPGIRLLRQEGPEPGKVNLLAVAGPGDGMDPDRGLTLNGHLDVVPAEPEGWSSDPFALEEREGKLYARGAADMKGFCALAVNRLARAASRDLAHPLGLLLTFDEEVGCLGARHFAREWPDHDFLPRNVVVGEPTELRVVRMHKGHLQLRVEIQGISAHTGSPHLGVNAVQAAAPVLEALNGLRMEWRQAERKHSEHFGQVPWAVLAVAGIRGGEAANIVPPLCEVEVGVRLLPGMTSGEAEEEVRRKLPGEVETHGEAGPARVTVAPVPDHDSPPFFTPEDAPLNRILCDLMEQTGTLGMPYGSDAGWLSTAGYRCVLWGPGTIEVAHKPDEYMAVRDLEEGGELLDRLIHRVCDGP